MNTKHRILVADDDLGARSLMQAALQRAGFEVSTVADGLAALEQFQARRPDIVLLDVDMPGRNGFEVCADMRICAGPLLPIVMVTGMDDTESVDSAYRAGATDFIAKPINWGLLGHRIRYLMRGYENASMLALAENQIRALLVALPDSLWEISAEGRILRGHAPEGDGVTKVVPGMTGRLLGEVMPANTEPVWRAALRETLEQGTSRGHQLEIESPYGLRCYELSASRKPGKAGDTPTVVVLARDVTARRDAEARVRHLAYFDALTQLPNRQYFRDEVTRALATARLATTQVALLCVDLDNFKRINDTLGHSVGDELLRMTAERMREALRGTDRIVRSKDIDHDAHCLSRLGGDEFTILLQGLDSKDDARAVAERIIAAISQPMHLAQHEVLITPSVGIAVHPDDGDDVEILMRNADLAMYFAKRQGSGAYAFYESAMNAGALKRLTMEVKLRTAIENGELSLAFQPQFEVATGALCGMEALLRWNNPELGSVPPAEFIPVAEDTGLIIPIGEWVLRNACRQATAWREAGYPTRVAVNVSGRQLLQRDFTALVEKVLAETSLASSALELEITESVLMANEAPAEAALKELRTLGVAVAIDDFGTGYSSFNRLRELSVDRLKIDRHFIERVQDCDEDRAIAAAMIRMAQTMNLGLVAEGVEEFGQLMVLQEEQCPQVQGYLLSRPIQAGQTLDYLKLAAENQKAEPSRTGRIKRLTG